MSSSIADTVLDRALATLITATNRDPFAVLGPHPEGNGFIVRAFHPAARAMDLRLVRTGELYPMTRRHPAGLFDVQLAEAHDYRLRITYPADHVVEIDDPYRYGRILTDFDLHLLAEGTHHRAFEKLGAHRLTVGTTTGVHFAVWAPNAERVSLIGDFNGWDGRVHPMRLLLPNGIWEIFIPELPDGEKYKFEIRAKSGELLKKSDPFGFAFEVPPNSSSVVHDISRYEWHDGEWMATRRGQGGWLERPMTIYEAHLGSW